MKPLRIAIVEDDHHEADALAKAVGKYWFRNAQVETCLSEEGCLAVIGEWAAGVSAPPDLVVLDRQLRWSEGPAQHPSGLAARDGGLRCLTALRACGTTERTPVVLHTVLATEGLAVQDAYLTVVPKTGDHLPLMFNIRSLLAAAGHDLPRLRGSPKTAGRLAEAAIVRGAALVGAVVVLAGALEFGTGWIGELWDWIVKVAA